MDYITEKGAHVRLIDELGEGVQGKVWKAEYSLANGERKTVAVKIENLNDCLKPNMFLTNIKKLAAIKNRPDGFLWPEDIIDQTTPNGRIFGYTMRLIPEGFLSLGDILSGKHGRFFSSYRANLAGAINLCQAFHTIHFSGLTFCDINNSGVYFDKNGNILIGDVDNVVVNGGHSEVEGAPEYRAPELVLGTTKPSIYTDRFSLSVLVHELLFFTHPLCGKLYFREDGAILTEPEMKNIFGTNPIYIMDPSDKRNAPVKKFHKRFIDLWNIYPDFMQDFFVHEFSRTRMTLKPEKRESESGWISILIRLKSRLLDCPNCKMISFQEKQKCPCCKSDSAAFVMHLSGVDYPVLAKRGLILYRSQLAVTNPDALADKVLVTGTLGGRQAIKNISGASIDYTIHGKNAPLNNQESLPLEDGLIIKAFRGTVSFKRI